MPRFGRRWSGKALAAALAAGLLLTVLLLNLGRNAPETRPSEVVGPTQTMERPTAEILDDRRPDAVDGAGAPRIALAMPGQKLVLRLARWPDGKRIARAVVDLSFDGSPAISDGPRISDAGGRLVIEAPGGGSVVEVAVAGFEPETVDLSTAAGSTAEHELRLRPLSGLFGRVVFEDGEPAGGASVRLVRAIETTAVSASSGGPPRVIVNKFESTGASTTTTSEGWYFLEWPTRTSSAPVELACAVEDGRQGSLVVQLPRPTDRLPDIVLAEPEGLLIKVLDEEDRPVAGANVWGRDSRGQALAGKQTDARGECWIRDPALPATYSATTPSAGLRSVRIDGVEHAPGHPVDSIDQRVELILRRVPTAVFLVVDQGSRTPVRTARGGIEFLDPSGQRVGGMDFESDGLGRVEAMLTPRNHPPELPITRIRLRFLGTDGYEAAVHEFSVAELSDVEPRTIELQPLSGTHFVRGRVLRAGQPAPGFEVGVVGIHSHRSAGFQVGTSVRCVTDDQGRFAVRWAPWDPGELVAVRPHWKNWEEFGALGPMPVADAIGRELVLEIEPGLRVPAIVRGVTRGGQYVVFVSAIRTEGLIPITINGAPIEAWQDGEIKTHVFVPSAWPSRLTLGYRTNNSIRPEVSPPVFFDPAAPVLPLVFDLAPIFARIEGTVAGVDPADLQALRVIAVQTLGHELNPQWELDQTVLASTKPREDGGFVLEQVPMGTCNLLLVRMAKVSFADVLASERVQVERDIAGLVLRP
jgi:hypothetical protein